MENTLVYNPTAEKAKRKVLAGVFGILFGAFGIHKFALGYVKEGIIMLLATILTFGLLSSIVGLIGLIEGIIYLSKTDEQFVATYVDERKGWF